MYGKRVLTIGVLLFSASSFSAEDAKVHPCKAVREACRAAGFVKGKDAPEGKHLFRDCVRPLAEGKTVEGVTISQDVVQACKAKRESRRKG